MLVLVVVVVVVVVVVGTTGNTVWNGDERVYVRAYMCECVLHACLRAYVVCVYVCICIYVCIEPT